MVTKKQTAIVGSLIVVILSTYAYVTLSNDLKLQVQKDKSIFYVNENGSWVVSGTEYNYLYNGTKLVARNTTLTNVTTTIDSINKTVKIVRQATYNNSVVIDTYMFDGNINARELFPIYHTIEIFNATGLTYQYNVKNLVYNGSTKTLNTTYFKAGKNMSVEWDSGFTSAKISSAGTLTVKYNINSSYVMYSNRLYDPTWWNTTWTCRVPITVTSASGKTSIIDINATAHPTVLGNISANGDGLAFVNNDNTTTYTYYPAYVNKTGASVFLINDSSQSLIWMYGCNTSVVTSYINTSLPTWMEEFNAWNSTRWLNTSSGAGATIQIFGGYLYINATYSTGTSLAELKKNGTTERLWSNATNVDLLVIYEPLDNGGSNGDWEYSSYLGNASFNYDTPLGFHYSHRASSPYSGYYMSGELDTGNVWTSWQPISFSARPLNQPNFIVTTFQPTADRVFTKLYNVNFTKVDNTANWTTYNVDSIESIYSISARDATEGSVIKSRIPIIIVYDNTSTTFAKGAVENYEAPAVMGITVVKPENTTYGPHIDVNVTTSVAADWCGWDIGGNHTMSHTTDTNWYSIIEDLPTSGTYQMIIWCNVSDGTATKNDTIWFTTDVTPPSIKVDVPLNTTYITGSIDINLTTSDAAACLYNIDGPMTIANTSLSNDSLTNWFGIINSGSLMDGTYQVNAYCNDTWGNMGLNNTIWFSVDFTEPWIDIHSPLNTTYETNVIALNTSVDESNLLFYYWDDDTYNRTGVVRDNPIFTATNYKGFWSNGTDFWFIYDEGTAEWINHTDSAGAYIDGCLLNETSAGNYPYGSPVGIYSNASGGIPTHFIISESGFDDFRLVDWNATNECKIQDTPFSTGIEDIYGIITNDTGVITNVIITDTTTNNITFFYNDSGNFSSMTNIMNTSFPAGCTNMYGIGSVDADEIIGFCDDNLTIRMYHNGTVIDRYNTYSLITGGSHVGWINSTTFRAYNATTTISEFTITKPLNQTWSFPFGTSHVTFWASDIWGNVAVPQDVYFSVIQSNISVAYNPAGTTDFTLNFTSGNLTFNYTDQKVYWWNATPDNQTTTVAIWNITTWENSGTDINYSIRVYLNMSTPACMSWYVANSSSLLLNNITATKANTSQQIVYTTTESNTSRYFWSWIDMNGCYVNESYDGYINFTMVGV